MHRHQEATAMHSERTFASLFSGIAGLDLGLHRRMRCTLMVEKEQHPRTVLSRHFPDTPIAKDVRNVNGADLGQPDVLVAGFPCKGMSVGGNRTGLRHEQSSLFWEIIRLVDEAQPEWLVIENPDGALTCNQGRDWLAVTSSLGRRGYGWAFRVLDGRSLPTPALRTIQKRTRVILVAHRGGDPAVPWSVLDDTGAGADLPPAVALAGTRPGGPGVAGDRGGARRDGLTVWRKSANARAAIEEGGWETWVRSDYANTLACYDPGGPLRQKHLLVQDGRLRTLTLTEWERLCGFPDGWTAGIPDGARFTALGNCVHVGTGEWVAQRLVAKMDALDAPVAAAV